MNVKIDKYGFTPRKAHEADAGYDIFTPSDVIVPPRGGATVRTGVHVEIPFGYAGMIKSKSGLNVKHDITAEGVVDSGYDGEIVVKLYNHGDEPYIFKCGDKITQLVIVPIYTGELTVVDEIEAGERGENGFGSTGR